MVINIKAGNLADAAMIAQIAPADEINIYDNTCPTGWTRVSAFDDKYLRGQDTYGGTGGANSHDHTHSLSVSAYPGENETDNSPATRTCLAEQHVHSLSGTTSENNSEPPYIEVIFCKRDAY